MSVIDVLKALWRSPRTMLVERWNWKSAIFSSVIRALIFFICNLKAGMAAATGAMAAEFAYRSVIAGFCGALTQSFRKVRPGWAATVAVIVLLPLVSHSIELGVHLLRHTPRLLVSIVTSVCFTIISTLFNLYAMRRGALIVGDEACSAASDLRRVPKLIAGFVACGPLTLYRVMSRLAGQAAVAVRLVSVFWIVLFVAAAALRGEATPQHWTRRYTATAYISVLSVPIFSRSGVGGGFASLEESQDSGRLHETLKFLSGSTPERTRGLNRLGYIREDVDEQNDRLTAVKYFGFITANREESLAQGKAALAATTANGTVEYVATSGLESNRTSRYSVRRLNLPARFQWENLTDLVGLVDARFAQAQETRGHVMPVSCASNTFLYALVVAIRSPEAVRQTQIIHNGKFYRLAIEKDVDRKTGSEFERLHLSSADHCLRVRGSLAAIDSKTETTFRLWYDEATDNPLPLRFEFRPRSFLRLCFDAVP